MGRDKNQTAPPKGGARAEPLRLAAAGEQYARVTALLGGGRFAAAAAPGGAPLACWIPGKFRGRRRRANAVAAGELVLVGARAWEARAGPARADLLEVYSREEAARLEARGALGAPAREEAEFAFALAPDEPQPAAERAGAAAASAEAAWDV